MVKTVKTEKQFRALAVLKRTVAKVNSIGLLVQKYVLQCSAGKS